MSWELAFSLTAVAVAPLWLLMIVAPRWHWTNRIMASPYSCAPLAVVYALLVIPRLGDLAPMLIRPELPAIARLLGTPVGATIAWVHFLAFDLFVGRWIYLDSRVRDTRPLLMAPILVLVVMFGPLGYLTYLALRRPTSPPRPASPRRAARPQG